ncbi:MAG: DUF3891 family protein [Alphaproteobacteria bacterium]
MIIQSTPEGQESGKRFVMKLAEHLELAGQFAENFGNDTFAQPEPREEFLYVCRWHDKGWQDLDDNPPLDPDTGLPYNLVETPLPIILLTSARSPEYNEAHHPYCGLIDSMHIWGLYNGRYGMSDKKLINMIPDEHRMLADGMLNNEFQRQQRLKATLGEDSRTAGWVEEGPLFSNYKVLQFFDTLALYFNCTHAAARGEAAYDNVPLDSETDTTITIRPVDGDTYSLDPYPFRESGLEISFQGRYLSPLEADAKPDMAAVMRDTPLERQSSTLVAA